MQDNTKIPPEIHMVSVKVPFSGLSNTVHEAMIDSTMEGINEDNSPDFICYSNVRWSKVMLDYTQAWLNSVKVETGLDMTFEKIESPRDYSMGNDVLIVKVPFDKLKTDFENMDAAKKSEWRDLVKSALTAREGFAPFGKYSNNADEWGPIAEWDDAERDLFFHLQVSGLIDEDLHAERASEMLEDAIWAAIIDPNIVPGHVDNENENGPQP